MIYTLKNLLLITCYITLLPIITISQDKRLNLQNEGQSILVYYNTALELDDTSESYTGTFYSLNKNTKKTVSILEPYGVTNEMNKYSKKIIGKIYPVNIEYNSSPSKKYHVLTVEYNFKSKKTIADDYRGEKLLLIDLEKQTIIHTEQGEDGSAGRGHFNNHNFSDKHYIYNSWDEIKVIDLNNGNLLETIESKNTEQKIDSLKRSYNFNRNNVFSGDFSDYKINLSATQNILKSSYPNVRFNLSKSNHFKNFNNKNSHRNNYLLSTLNNGDLYLWDLENSSLIFSIRADTTDNNIRGIIEEYHIGNNYNYFSTITKEKNVFSWSVPQIFIKAYRYKSIENYGDRISEKIAKDKHSDIYQKTISERGEFETTDAYEQRVKKFKNVFNDFKTSIYDSLLTLQKSFKADVINRINNSFYTMVSLGKYNIDTELLNISLPEIGEDLSINVKSEKAKDIIQGLRNRDFIRAKIVLGIDQTDNSLKVKSLIVKQDENELSYNNTSLKDVNDNNFDQINFIATASNSKYIFLYPKNPKIIAMSGTKVSNDSNISNSLLDINEQPKLFDSNKNGLLDVKESATLQFTVRYTGIAESRPFILSLKTENSISTPNVIERNHQGSKEITILPYKEVFRKFRIGNSYSNSNRRLGSFFYKNTPISLRQNQSITVDVPIQNNNPNLSNTTVSMLVAYIEKDGYNIVEIDTLGTYEIPLEK